MTAREQARLRRSQAHAAMRSDPLRPVLLAAGAAWLVLFAAATWWTRDSESGQRVVGELVSLVPVAGAAVLAVVVARRARSDAWFWRLLALSNLLWLAGDLTFAVLTHLLHREAPVPSVADALHLGSCALVPLAVLVGFRTSGTSSVRGLIDAGLITAALGFTGWRLLIEPQLGAGGGWRDAATLTGVAHPLLGVVILVTLVAVATSSDRDVPVPVLMITFAFAVSAVTDAAHTWSVVLHDHLPGRWLGLGWQLEAVVMCLALVVALRHDEAGLPRRHRGSDLTLLPVLASVAAALALLAADAVDGLPLTGVLAAMALPTTLVLRFAVTLADQRATTVRLDEALGEQERLAVTDGLTGLYNRRFFTELLALEVERSQRTARPVSLVAIDVDHFKRVNDTHGHPGGDAVLVEVGHRLSAALRSSDVLARTGGEEFCVVAQDSDAAAARDVAERLHRAVRASPVTLPGGALCRVTVSLGVATLRVDDSLEGLVRRADRGLYAAKDTGRDRVVAADGAGQDGDEGVDPALLTVLARVGELLDHRSAPDERSGAVVCWSEQVAEHLGMSAPARTRVALAARLHGVGALGALLELVPADVVALVRAAAERYDGGGPRGLAGEDIPLGGRVIAVAAAHAAATAPRSGGHPRVPATPQEAEAALVAGAGSAYDPAVVGAFLVLRARELAAPDALVGPNR